MLTKRIIPCFDVSDGVIVGMALYEGTVQLPEALAAAAAARQGAGL